MITVYRAALMHIIDRHGGNRTAIQRAHKWSGNTVRRLITLHGLTSHADAAAVASKRFGPRAQAPQESMAMERDALLNALAAWHARDAAAYLEISLPTLYRRKRKYEITHEEIESLRVNLKEKP